MVKPIAHPKELTIFEDVPKDLLLRLDPRMIASVLRNLMTNAFKFSKKGGRIEISAKQLENGVHVEVRDYGVGMVPEQIDLLTKMDAPKSTTGTSGEKGTGIGISLARKFLEQHGSDLNIDSEPDVGTRASFTLTTVP